MTTEPIVTSTIATGTHGRYLLRPCESALVLVGFHGYGENAEAQMARLEAIPGAERWLVVSIQGLHSFYERRTDRVVASWMTRQDRDTAIADNLAYVARVIDAAIAGRTGPSVMVFAGFSQGVAMAFRAASLPGSSQRHVIAVGNDIPPELTASDLARLDSVLVCRGADDPWYAAAAFERDCARLKDAGTVFQAVAVPGGHEWSQPVLDATAGYLAGLAAGI